MMENKVIGCQLIKYPARNEWDKLVQRATIDVTSLFGTVQSILNDIRINGDAVIRKYEKQFDKVELSNLLVSEKEMQEANGLVSEELKQAILTAKQNIETFHAAQRFEGKKIATSYPHILSAYLAAQNVNAEIHVITGSVEVAPGIGLSDAIFDIVSSGSTLVSNSLKEVEVVMKSEALLIGNKSLDDQKQEILKELLFRMNAVKMAEDKKYVLMNAPKSKLEQILAVLPGMKSPTVMPLAQDGWCSVHTVLDEKCFWEIIGKLKALGAEGILVLPIEKMII